MKKLTPLLVLLTCLLMPVTGFAATITGVTPSSGTPAGGTVLTITGSGFNNATGVTIGGVAAASYTKIDSTNISATTPAGTGTGKTVTVAANIPGTWSGTFSYLPPVLSSISPAGGTTYGGTTVTISGSYFTGASGVKFGTTDAAFTVNSDSSITATSPAASAGAVNVTVISGGQTSNALTFNIYITTTTGIASDINPSGFTLPVTFTATVTPPTATGTVTFKEGASVLGTGTFFIPGDVTAPDRTTHAL